MNAYILLMFYASTFVAAPTQMTLEQCQRVGSAFVEAGKQKWGSGSRYFECHAVTR